MCEITFFFFLRVAHHFEKAIPRQSRDKMYFYPIPTLYRSFMNLLSSSKYPTDEFCGLFRATIALFYILKLDFLDHCVEDLKLPKKKFKMK